MPAPKVILFDLDGTLLEVHTEPFIASYFKVLSSYVSDHYDPKQLTAHILDATKAMIDSVDPQKTNEQVFTEHFLRLAGLTREQIWPLFEKFYRDVFPTLVDYTQPSPWAQRIVAAAQAHGYKLVVATNPVFPRDAICSRLAWLNLSPNQFDLITAYEDCHFTKPHLNYYREICDRLGVQPTDCIMVGNHMQEDMVAGQLGMKTFLVTNYLEDRGEPVYPVDQRGTISELYQAITERSGIFSPE